MKVFITIFSILSFGYNTFSQTDDVCCPWDKDSNGIEYSKNVRTACMDCSENFACAIINPNSNHCELYCSNSKDDLQEKIIRANPELRLYLEKHELVDIAANTEIHHYVEFNDYRIAVFIKK